jgi:hypothetical protein
MVQRNVMRSTSFRMTMMMLSVSARYARRLVRGLICLGTIYCCGATARAASIVVAPVDAPRELKLKADLVCNGYDDQDELLQSITKAKREAVEIEGAGGQTALCYTRHSVEWLAGTYNLEQPLVLPDCSDVVIQAEGTRFNFTPTSGDAIRIQGLQRCRFYLGTIGVNGAATAIHLQPTAAMPAQYSTVNYMGLEASLLDSARGLWLDNASNDIACNTFDGTWIHYIKQGIVVGAVAPTQRFCRGNWLWVSFVLGGDFYAPGGSSSDANPAMPMDCVWETENGTQGNTYKVNVEANATNSVGCRIGGDFGMWNIIMGTHDWHARAHDGNETRAIILDAGSRDNLIEVHPYLSLFAPFDDFAHDPSNVILSTDRPPYHSPAYVQEYLLNQGYSSQTNPSGTWSFRDSAGTLLPLQSNWNGADYPVWAPSTSTTPLFLLGNGQLFAVPADTVAMHGPAELRWTAPCNALIDLSGTVHKNVGGDGRWLRLTIRHNSSEISHLDVPDGNPLPNTATNPLALSGGTGGGSALTFSVSQGDTVSFINTPIPTSENAQSTGIDSFLVLNLRIFANPLTP